MGQDNGVSQMIKVFVSHTDELSSWPAGTSCVQAALDALRAASMHAVEMRDFSAADRPPVETCERAVLDCDWYVGLIGFRYGSKPEGESRSYTEFEFDTATSKKKRRLLFVLDPSLLEDRALARDEDRTAINRFRNKITSESGLTVKILRARDNIQFEVYKSLIEAFHEVSSPDLPERGWLFTGDAGPTEARLHFHNRALGQQNADHGGDLFRGRVTAVRKVREWLTAAERPGRVLVVTGPPGSGKSSVVSRAVLNLAREADSIDDSALLGLAFHARSATADRLLAAVADVTQTPLTESVGELIETLGREGPFVRVVVDALDEAASETDRELIAEILVELARLPQFRVTVATRPLNGVLLRLLGVYHSTDSNLLDVDDKRYVDPDGLKEFAAALLRQDGATDPAPPGGAWEHYREDFDICGKLAQAIAERAKNNFLIAALTADQLSRQEAPVGASFDRADLPDSVGGALDRNLRQLAATERTKVRRLLVALAYARGAGVDDLTWLSFHRAISEDQTSMSDIEHLRSTLAVDYILQQSSRAGGRVTRVFHQALIDELIVGQPHNIDEARIFAMLRPPPGETWATVSSYARTHAADHAFAAGEDALTSLLLDIGYATVTDLPRLRSLLPAHPTSNDVAHVVAVLRTAASLAHPLQQGERRANFFALTAAQLGFVSLSHRYATCYTPSVSVPWAHTLGAANEKLPGHTDRVGAVATGRVDDRDVIVTGCDDEQIRIFDAVTGQLVVPPLSGHTDRITGLALGRVDGTDVVVSGSADGTVRVWDASSGDPLPSPSTHVGAVFAVALDQVGNHTMLAYAGADAKVRRWDLGLGATVGDPMEGHRQPIRALAMGKVVDRPVIVSGSADQFVRVWDAEDGSRIGAPLTGHQGQVTSVAIGTVDGTAVIVSGSTDREVRIWRWIDDRFVPGHVLAGHTGEVTALALGPVDGRMVIISASIDQTILMWDATTGELIRRPLAGHASAIRAIDLGHAGEREIIASGGDDRTARIWDSMADEFEEIALPGHHRTVQSIAVGGDFVTSTDGSRMRVWDKGSGKPVHELTVHGHHFNAVAIGTIDGGELIAAGSGDDLVTLWDAASGQAVGSPLGGHRNGVRAVAVGTASSLPIVASGSDDHTVMMWDVRGDNPFGESVTVHDGPVLTVAIGGTSNQAIVVSGGRDRTVRVFNAATRQPAYKPLNSSDVVHAVAVGTVAKRLTIVAACGDGTLCRWNAMSGEQLTSMRGHVGRVNAVAIGRVGSQDLIISGGEDQTIRVWDDHRELFVLDTHDPVTAVAIDGGRLYFAAGLSICAIVWGQPSIGKHSQAVTSGPQLAE